MKKVLITLLLLAAFSLFSQENISEELSKNVILYTQLNIMADNSDFLENDGFEQMQTFSMDLDNYYKDYIYNKYEQKSGGTITLNLLTGGLGSILAGHFMDGVIIEILSTLSIAGSAYYLFVGSNELSKKVLLASEIAGGAGLSLSIALPLVRSSSYNKKLKKALNY